MYLICRINNIIGIEWNLLIYFLQCYLWFKIFLANLFVVKTGNVSCSLFTNVHMSEDEQSGWPVGASSSGDFFDMLIGCNRTQQIIKECFNNKQWKRVFSILARGKKSILKNESFSGRTKRVLVDFILTEAQVQ